LSLALRNPYVDNASRMGVNFSRRPSRYPGDDINDQSIGRDLRRSSESLVSRGILRARLFKHRVSL